MKPLTLIVGLGLVATGLAGTASAQNPACADRAGIVARLAETYGETRQAIGLASAGQVVEVFASETTGTWTITVTRPDGTACLVATGEHFERLDDRPDAAMRGDPV